MKLATAVGDALFKRVKVMVRYNALEKRVSYSRDLKRGWSKYIVAA